MPLAAAKNRTMPRDMSGGDGEPETIVTLNILVLKRN
jgi:hypothetical protein